jgi:uncharacterized coiled-coil DUF342 family protein
MQLQTEIVSLLELLYHALEGTTNQESADLARQKIVRQILQIQSELTSLHLHFQRIGSNSGSLDDQIHKMQQKIQQLQKQQHLYHSALQDLIQKATMNTASSANV